MREKRQGAKGRREHYTGEKSETKAKFVRGEETVKRAVKELGEEEFTHEGGREFHSGILTARKDERKRVELLEVNSRPWEDLRAR